MARLDRGGQGNKAYISTEDALPGELPEISSSLLLYITSRFPCKVQPQWDTKDLHIAQGHLEVIGHLKALYEEQQKDT